MTVAQRGAEALLRFRMDFLLLLPNRARVVVEIDGKHHYGDEQGQVRPERDARMALADRELRLAGYEVYRFGVQSSQMRRSLKRLPASSSKRSLSGFTSDIRPHRTNSSFGATFSFLTTSTRTTPSP